MSDLTDVQMRVLRAVRDRPGMNASSVCDAAGIKGTKRPLRPQGAGRIAGGILAKLARLGLVWEDYRLADHRGRRFSAGWQITAAGRTALKGGGDVDV